MLDIQTHNAAIFTIINDKIVGNPFESTLGAADRLMYSESVSG